MENSILRYLKGCDGELYGRIVRTLKVYRGIDFDAECRYLSITY